MRDVRVLSGEQKAIEAWNTHAELPAAYASISPSIDMLREHGVVVEHTCHNADQSNP